MVMAGGASRGGRAATVALGGVPKRPRNWSRLRLDGRDDPGAEVAGEAAVTLAAGGLEATFLPEIGMLGASLRHDGESCCVLPAGLAGYRAGNQAGLPLLAPWAKRRAPRRFAQGARSGSPAWLPAR